ncbi:MAG: DM13 domain-containing protein [Saprospiraceae bacterium]|nr:DM13 domain-containing protein [Saprospiraceae bacterium]
MIIGCSKDQAETVIEEIDMTAAVLFSGSFSSEVHTTSGKVSVVKTTDGKNLLRLEGLISDNGPDLRLYLAEDKKALNAIEIVSKPKNGTYDLPIPSGVDYSKHKYVLIWCKQFTVLFGSAELK